MTTQPQLFNMALRKRDIVYTPDFMAKEGVCSWSGTLSQELERRYKNCF